MKPWIIHSNPRLFENVTLYLFPSLPASAEYDGRLLTPPSQGLQQKQGNVEPKSTSLAAHFYLQPKDE